MHRLQGRVRHGPAPDVCGGDGAGTDGKIGSVFPGDGGSWAAKGLQLCRPLRRRQRHHQQFGKRRPCEKMLLMFSWHVAT